MPLGSGLTHPAFARHLSCVIAREVVVLGAGPAGLGAALALAREGARVVVFEGDPAVGGLCTTRRNGVVSYDIGGHIPFVRDDARLEWLRELVCDHLSWVPRPVASVRGGIVRRGRYLDQRADGPPGGPVSLEVDPPAPTASAATVLADALGAEHVERELRGYLEKIDGVTLERMPGTRPLKLMRDQAAPEGFWFPIGGIGALMEAMAWAIVDAGGEIILNTQVTAIHAPRGRVVAIEATGPKGQIRLGTRRVVVSIPAGRAARLLRPAPVNLSPVPMRAVSIVYVEMPRSVLGDEAWIQVDHPDVPFARIFEMGNWSPVMTPQTTILGMECYGTAVPSDPLWPLDDAALAARCVAALTTPLGWLNPSEDVRVVDVIRLPNAYPVPDIANLAAIAAPAVLLAQIEGVAVAPGAAVIEAIEHGERAAAAVMAAR